jgi:hypothetical protein
MPPRPPSHARLYARACRGLPLVEGRHANPRTNAMGYDSFPFFHPSVGHPSVPKRTWVRRVQV